MKRSISIILSWCCCCGPVSAQQDLSVGEGIPLLVAHTSDDQQSAPEYVAPSDGGLGSTMTLQQMGMTGEQRESAEQTPILWVTPTDEPSPALKHRLWVPDYELQPGSATLHFGRALLIWEQTPKNIRERIESWMQEEELPVREDREEIIESLTNLYKELHLLAISEDQEWDHRLRDLTGPELYAYRFPEYNTSRDLGRLLRFKIEHQLTDQDVAGAVKTLRDGFRLARFVGQGETLVQQAVGIAIEHLMLDQVQALIQVPDCPNMYWASATLPRPLIDINRSMAFELSSIHRVFPVLADAEQGGREEAYWNERWTELAQSLRGLNAESRLFLAVIGSAAISPAKQRLVERGMEPDAVQAMAPMRAVLLDALLEVTQKADELAKAGFLPYYLGTRIGEEAEQDFTNWIRENQMKSLGAAMVGMLFPAMQAARAAGVRQLYKVNRLMTIEALRLHAHHHNGQLPNSLDQLSPAPALPNPFTGKPFEYELRSEDGHPVVSLTAEVPLTARFMRQITIHFRARQ